MSAKKKPKPPGGPSGSPSASPADGGNQGRKLRREDWDFSVLLKAYHAAGKNPDSPEGREITAAALYEYARESVVIRKLCTDAAVLEFELAEKYGQRWVTGDTNGWDDFIVGASISLPDAMMLILDPVHQKLDAWRFALKESAQRMGAGAVLLTFLKKELASDLSWLRIEPAHRREVIAQAWAESPPPRWTAAPKGEIPVDRENFFGATYCGPAFPRDLLSLAERDEEAERLSWRAEIESKLTEAESSRRMAQTVKEKWEGRGLRERNPYGPECVAFELDWTLSDDEMVATFRGMLERWRPDEWREFAKLRAKNVQAAAALRDLAALRLSSVIHRQSNANAMRKEFLKIFNGEAGSTFATVFDNYKRDALRRLEIFATVFDYCKEDALRGLEMLEV